MRAVGILRVLCAGVKLGFPYKGQKIQGVFPSTACLWVCLCLKCGVDWINRWMGKLA